MKILQITDLHFGKHDTGIQASLLSRVKVIKPDLILATGDLADTPKKKLFVEAKAYLEDLCEAAGPEGKPAKLIAIPGNHDAAWTGIVRAFTKNKFWNFFPVIGDYFDPSQGVWIYPFDSATKARFFDFSRGMIGDGELTRFHTRYDELEQTHGRVFSDAYKIVVLHHHPLPVNFETDAKQPWLTINNAGALLGAALQKKTDLVLHGHEHLQERAFLRSTLGGSMTHGMHVLSLGATLRTVKNPNRNWFYLIEIGADRTVKANAFQSQGKSFISKPFETIVLRSSREVGEKVFNSTKQDGLRVGSISASTIVTQDGDARRTVEYRDVEARGKKIAEHRLDLPGTSGYIDLGSLEARSSSKGFGGLHLKKPIKTGAIHQSFSAELDFGGTKLKAGDKLRFWCQWWALNAFAMDRIQYQRKYPGSGSWREFSRFDVSESESVKELVVSVQFPPGLAPQAVDLRVENQKTGDRDDEHARELRDSGAIQFVEKLGTAMLRVPFPRSGRSYAIEWTVPAKGTDVPPANPVLDDLRPQLLAEERQEFVVKALHDLLGALIEAARLSEGVCTDPAGKPWKGSLHATLMFFDPVGSELRLLEVMPPGGSGLQDVDYRNLGFEYGVGVCGRVFKSNETRLYVRDLAASEEGPDYYISGKVDDAEVAVLLSLPLRWKDDDAFPYGVLNLSSPQNACPLRDAGSGEIEAYHQQACLWASKTFESLAKAAMS